MSLCKISFEDVSVSAIVIAPRTNLCSRVNQPDMEEN